MQMTTPLTSRIASRSGCLVTFGLALLLAGCRSSQPGSASFASVVIPNRTAVEIQEAAVQVFQADGYQAFRNGAEQLLFDKEGTHGQNIAHEGLVGTHYGAQTIQRVRVEVVDKGGGQMRLQCQAFVVTGAGDPFFEKEKRLPNFRAKQYQELLDQVAARLK